MHYLFNSFVFLFFILIINKKTIAETNVGNGSTEQVETNTTLTSLSYPPKVIHCVWENGSHINDLTQLAMTRGNHFAVSMPSEEGGRPALYYLNICRPLNPIREKDYSDKGCGGNSSACRIGLGDPTNESVLSLGEPTGPPFTGFDGSVNLIYENGSPCPTNKSKRISTRIKFECEPGADLSHPSVYEPGSEQTDKEECIYFFVWQTSAVCDVIEPTKVDNNLCVFTDRRTGLSANLSSLRRLASDPYKVMLSQNESIELNVCGLANQLGGVHCAKSSVCLNSNQNDSQLDEGLSYGLLKDNGFNFDEINSTLTLRYFNGSKCLSNSNSGRMSSEIIFKCNADAKGTTPKLQSHSDCIVVFEWETDLVCNLQIPKCSVIGADDKFYNLRQLSSISHAWNVTDREGNIYFLNVCTKLPQTIKCLGVNAASCRCKYDDNNTLVCAHNLGDPSTDELTVAPNGDLLLTYRNGYEEQCEREKRSSAQTQITFKCRETIGKPKFLEFDRKQCIYRFEWNTFMACPVSNRSELLLPMANGLVYDNRIDAYMNVTSLMTTTFNVTEKRELENKQIDEYTYVINLSKAQLVQSKDCSNAAVCQTKAPFERDIGSLGTIKYYLKGHELQIVLESLGAKKCGKNKNKNVTTILRLQCSLKSGLGKPIFMYESNDCDYTFHWETEMVCPERFLNNQTILVTKPVNDPISVTTPAHNVKDDDSKDKNDVKDDDSKSPATTSASDGQSESSKEKSSHSNVWIGIVIVMFFVVTLTVLVIYKHKVRESLGFRFRRLFGPKTTDPTFHYHQISL